MPLPATGDLQLPKATAETAMPCGDRGYLARTRSPVLHSAVGNPYFPRVCTLPLPESPPLRARGRNPRQRAGFDPPGSLGYPCQTLRTSWVVVVALSGCVFAVAGDRSANFSSPAYRLHLWICVTNSTSTSLSFL